ncbi:hypothetical protein [Lysinibacillus sp. fls2-241-R2A-57]|uniref:hypothetical protein n=1 Tax=Lysinibacillus sp. fls2-241-R2A-57 TaxID=3040292 RepID=UPI002553693D|nr:hypothetical protein [Lysinibacillus sp. fls2-241-R2A-57]
MLKRMPCRLILVPVGRLLEDSVTDEALELGSRVKRLNGRPEEALLCAKMKRQQQMFSVRKRSSSNKCFLCESEAAATKSPVGTEINPSFFAEEPKKSCLNARDNSFLSIEK